MRQNVLPGNLSDVTSPIFTTHENSIKSHRWTENEVKVEFFNGQLFSGGLFQRSMLPIKIFFEKKPEKQKKKKKKDSNIPYVFVDIGHYGNTFRLALQNMHHQNISVELLWHTFITNVLGATCLFMLRKVVIFFQVKHCSFSMHIHRCRSIILDLLVFISFKER